MVEYPILEFQMIVFTVRIEPDPPLAEEKM